MLATVPKGSINVAIDLDNHRVLLDADDTGNNKALLIRIPIGVRLFKVQIHGGFFIYYETAAGYNILPHYIKEGTDPDQLMQELVLVLSAVPPRDASVATQPIDLKKLSLMELNVRLKQEGSKPISMAP